ncbi:MAG: NUDIX domain-containing protein [Minisyncoccia bacterium]
MQIKAQAIVYKIIKGEIYCLCLKRCLSDGGFWHVITGTFEDAENDKSCLQREIMEELGEQKILNISPRLKEWIWKKNNDDIVIYDYALCLDDNDIILNEEHTEFVWLKPEEAYNKYEKTSAKEMISLLKNYLFQINE